MTRNSVRAVPSGGADALLPIAQGAEADAANVTQKSEPAARAVLEQLVEWSLVEARGERRGRVYHLGAIVYRQLGEAAGSVRTRGFDKIRRQAMVSEFVQAHGSIRRADVVELCALTPREATRLLDEMTRNHRLLRLGTRRGAYYVAGPED